MRSFLFILLLVLIFCGASFAQTSKPSNCPTISLASNLITPDSAGFIVYTVFLSNGTGSYNVKYNWTVQNGKIVSGQGTSIVKIKIDADSLNTTVEITGLPANCANNISESFIIDRVYPIKFDEYSISVSQINKASLDSLATELQNDPNANVYIFEKFQQNISQKLIKRKIQKTTDYLSKIKGITKDRIVILTIRKKENLTQILIVPAGAKPPSIDDN